MISKIIVRPEDKKLPPLEVTLTEEKQATDLFNALRTGKFKVHIYEQTWTEVSDEFPPAKE